MFRVRYGELVLKEMAGEARPSPSVILLKSRPTPATTGEPFSCEILGIDVTGRVATATVRETDHHGVVIDYFHLLKSGDTWSIVSKLWDAEPVR